MPKILWKPGDRFSFQWEPGKATCYGIVIKKNQALLFTDLADRRGYYTELGEIPLGVAPLLPGRDSIPHDVALAMKSVCLVEKIESEWQ